MLMTSFGLSQVLADFRAGAFNTLVATCIGEEGLDIPQASSPGNFSLHPSALCCIILDSLTHPGHRLRSSSSESSAMNWTLLWAST